jgi:hypothetical protein
LDEREGLVVGKKQKHTEVGGPALYKLQVMLYDGPVTEDFINRNQEVWRTIAIRGDQTLEDLHWAIFDAFDRDDPHMYEFQFGKKPHDRKAKRYVMPEVLEGDFLSFALEKFFSQGASDADLSALEYLRDEDATVTTIGSLPLKPRSVFWYWFDFGDDWWHKIKVVSIEKEYPKDEYPKVVDRVGESPPQYPHLGDLEDEQYLDDEE